MVEYGNESIERMFGTKCKRGLNSTNEETSLTPAKRNRVQEKSRAIGHELRQILDLSRDNASGLATAKRDRAQEKSSAMKQELKHILDGDASLNLRSTMQHSLTPSKLRRG